MRIVGGEFRGRRFTPPTKTPARPTTDIAKEGLFNILQNMMDLEDIKTLELFGGTGNISYELASRGAAELTIVEQDRGNINFIIKTTKELDVYDRFKIIKGDAFKFMKNSNEQYDLIFADAPYALPNMDDIPMMVFEHGLLAPDGIFVHEHTHSNDYQQHPNFLRMKNYGTTVFTFFNNPS